MNNKIEEAQDLNEFEVALAAAFNQFPNLDEEIWVGEIRSREEAELTQALSREVVVILNTRNDDSIPDSI